VRGYLYYLYLVVDLFSRKIIAAEMHDHECSTLEAELVAAACKRTVWCITRSSCMPTTAR
jgi:transposase InsO family protein